MGSAINNIKIAISSVVTAVATKSNHNYRLGLMLFDEGPAGYNMPYTTSDDYTNLPSVQKYAYTDAVASRTQLITVMEVMSPQNQVSFTNQLSKINTGSFTLGSGYPYPEPGDVALAKAYDGMAGTFRDGVAKIVILITDAPSSGTDDIFDATDTAYMHTLTTQYYNKNIRVLMLTTAGMANDATNPYLIIVNGTNGSTYTPITDATKIVDAINAIP